MLVISAEADTLTAIENPSKVIQVVIIEDQKQIREGLGILINGSEGFHCSGSFPSAEEALSAMRSVKADVALVDIGLPGISGIEAVRRLKDRHPSLLFLMLIVH